ncbi:MAG: 16S rRNA (guanine(527)-N(7))-methyltransferase RsmG, partial [Bdellovibrionales bacterium]|nr:16S rRNA (guanine(527)-N(7))-methyltransferase RsmG [Bdellovibrionales bacterium]
MAHKNRSNWSPYKARKKSSPQGASPNAADDSKRPTVNQGSRHRRSTENFTLEEAQDRLRDLFERHGL